MAFDKITQAKFDQMNLEENKVEPYKILDVLLGSNVFEWCNKIRSYYLNEFKNVMYGSTLGFWTC